MQSTRSLQAGRLSLSRVKLLDLAPREVYLAIPVARHAGGHLPHRFTRYLFPNEFGTSAGLLSVALAVTRPQTSAFPLGSTLP